ncbi:MAG: TRAP-type C4-dicarboxylate transport system permease small subunit [Desulforhopalus sp.]|jgi:TRAP-type C4-dicarboxylate transport system permease small subunit
MNTVTKNSKEPITSLVYSLPSDRAMFRFINRLEDLALSLILIAMILLACTQIFLRTFLSSGLLWADPLLRYLVLWCGLIGAVAATGQGKHIALDVLSRKIPEPLAPWLNLITLIFCFLASAGLAWAAVIFLQGELEFGSSGPLSLPLWFWNSIFPVAFCLITLKYLFLSFLQLRRIFQMKHVKG